MNYLNPEIGLKKTVIEYPENNMKVLYGLRKDYIPIILKKKLKETERFSSIFVWD
jgi:hypothetical protein